MARFTDYCTANVTFESNAPGVTVLTKGGTTIVDFCTPGTYTWSPPTGVTQATFEIWGGGGGSAAICCCICGEGGTSSAGGGYASYTASVNPSDVYNICVGAGGWQCVNNGCNLACCCGTCGCCTTVTGGYFTTVGCPLTATGGCGSGSSLCCACGGDSRCVAYSVPGYGCGPIGTIAMCGSMGNMQSASGVYGYFCGTYGFAGSAPKTSGVSWTTYDHCNFQRCGCPAAFPGGGSEMAILYTVCCWCNWNVNGAGGLARITY